MTPKDWQRYAFLLSSADLKELAAIAEGLKRSRSELLRDIIHNYLAEEGRKK
jgi:metal-responsive CopG/Arc/MetJ family transcriptional regulator